LRGEAVERTPVWAMRQAGRWDPEFQKLRHGKSFYEFSASAELAAAASLCPRRFGVDGIILFYDITTLAIAMGQEFELLPARGPVPPQPIRTTADVDRLTDSPDDASLRHVVETLRIVRREVDGTLPALVFAGAPFTLATYQIGAGKDLAGIRRFIVEQPTAWRQLLEKTTTATISFLKLMLAEGGAAYQLFDSWAGELTDAEYLEHAQPFHRRIFEEVGGTSILFVKDAPHIPLMAESGARVLSLGTGHDLAALQERYPHLVFQGNVDHMLLVHGSADDVRRATHACLDAGGGRRHVLNLDHGMDREAKVENFEAFIDAARNPNRR
ncbi:MAG: uroporphyrinogen decarboxylase family protein, partial [Planctomycetia bacterium]